MSLWNSKFDLFSQMAIILMHVVSCYKETYYDKIRVQSPKMPFSIIHCSFMAPLMIIVIVSSRLISSLKIRWCWITKKYYHNFCPLKIVGVVVRFLMILMAYLLACFFLFSQLFNLSCTCLLTLLTCLRAYTFTNNVLHCWLHTFLSH